MQISDSSIYSYRKIIAQFLILSSITLAFPPKLFAGEESWRTYTPIEERKASKLLGDCSSKSHGKLDTTVNMMCLELDANGRFNGLIIDDISIARWTRFSKLSWWAKDENNRVNTSPPHFGLLAIFRGSTPLKVKVKFNSPDFDQLTGEESERLFEKAANDLGLIEFDKKKHLDSKQKVFENKKNLTKPPCDNLVLTGFAAGNARHLHQMYQEEDPRKLIPYNPISCTFPTRPGQLHWCDGLIELMNKKAVLVDWGEDNLQVEVELDFNIGRRSALLIVKRETAKCVK